MSTSQTVARLFLFVLLISQSACIGTTPPSQFYLLEPAPVGINQAAVAAPNKPAISLAPIRIPRYLDRAQIVTATGKNTYRLDELHRWAEGLDDNMTRVVLQNLSDMVPADVVVSRHERGSKMRLVVTILEFHIDSAEQAVLSAQWQISKGDETLLSRQQTYKLPADKDDVPAEVEALNQCLNQLSRDIATALKVLSVS
ncbi:PqiC family protein [Methylomonas sp. MgM2]